MEDYVKLEIVGSGSYGTVFRCRHKVTGEIVAVKQLKDDDANDLIRKTAVREARILKQLQHPHVVRLLELFRSKTRLYMVFEFMDQTILKLLEGKARGLPSGEVKRILWQLVLALTFLHGQRIIHRDLKPENVLIDDKVCLPGQAHPSPAQGLPGPRPQGPPQLLPAAVPRLLCQCARCRAPLHPGCSQSPTARPGYGRPA
ncbi:pancreatic alpha-amylase, partial [Haematococcus lacustris]